MSRGGGAGRRNKRGNGLVHAQTRPAHPNFNLPPAQASQHLPVPLADPFNSAGPNGLQYQVPFFPPQSQQAWAPLPMSSPLNSQHAQQLLAPWEYLSGSSPGNARTIHEQAFEDNDMDDEDDYECEDDSAEPGSSAGANNRSAQPPELSQFEPGVPQLVTQDPDHAPIERRKRQAEPAITNSEARDIHPPARRRLDVQISADATNPAPPMASVPVVLTMPQTPSRTAASVTALYTPFALPLVPKPILKPQSPTTTTLVEAAAIKYRLWLVTINGFPTMAERKTRIDQLFADATPLVTGKGPRRLDRYKGDSNYKLTIQRLIGRLGSNLRGAVADTCRDMCTSAFDLYGLPTTVAGNIVSDMLDNHTYHFHELVRQPVEKDGQLVIPRDGKVIKRKFAYRHVLIEQVIRNEFFQDHQQLGMLDLDKDTFNPMPVEVIALVVTAIVCALEEWRTGVHRKGKVHFKHDMFKPIYDMHLARLRDIVAEAPDDSLRWRRLLFTRCSSGLLDGSGGLSASGGDLTASEKTDFSDLPL